jgi:hypothetical protein
VLMQSSFKKYFANNDSLYIIVLMERQYKAFQPKIAASCQMVSLIGGYHHERH